MQNFEKKDIRNGEIMENSASISEVQMSEI